MSVPVRYSAAAEYAVVDSGLDNTLTQEEQYHRQQQQQQLQHQHQQYQQQQQYEQQQYQQQQYEQEQQEILLYCQLQEQLEAEAEAREAVRQQQQQLMQQRSSMSSSSGMPGLELPININNNNIINSNIAASNSNINNNNMDAVSINAILVDDEQPSTSAQAAAAAATAMLVGGNNKSGIDHNAEMPTDWMRIANEGRYGTPGAAGLEYQKYEQQQQQQQQSLEAEAGPAAAAAAEPTTALKKLEDQLHALTSDELYETLKEYDALQDKYHTVLLLPKESRREVTAGGRDGSAYVLRCLKMWYELPSDVLFSAMSLVDRFLDRMAVKPKHMACMSVASFHLAIKQLDLKPIPADDLVTISQCGCTAGDLERMAGVIANKLGVQMGHAPITSVSYLRIYYALFRNLAKEIGGDFFKFYQQLIKLEELENRLEILLCDVKTTVITPATLALVLICLHLDFHIKESYTRGSPELKHVFEYILFLQQYMRIPDRVFTCGFSIVSGILSHYNGQNKAPYKQRLVWKLSSRTLRVLRPTNRFSSDLPTIEEGISNALDDGLRSRTESISSEEEEDWPTSPIIPIFEQC
ncbi:cyclin G [Drosophila sulfurigaster albostrigata]|uniref:cyclin G n=1 Tax=Drosophila sulfurigaster albostrigata TaxID=89887 RepID=UPI002D21D72F|nr:cyclin G [Drosophila sulfurigaster albostrigata]XP_062122960.1 cyclin G [Drosophila sulfurigaster albostrigata]